METDLNGGGARAARKEDRRQAILDIAERSFLERGFAETSMSAIAAACGGSKTTLWSHFPSKEALFNAFLDRRLDLFEGSLEDALGRAQPVDQVLRLFAHIFIAKVTSHEACALRRVLGAESQRFPALARSFYERGPARARRRLTAYMEEKMAAGSLRRGDAGLAARQFLALCQAGVFADIVWHRGESPPTDIEAEVENAVTGFLRMWGPGV